MKPGRGFTDPRPYLPGGRLAAVGDKAAARCRTLDDMTEADLERLYATHGPLACRWPRVARRRRRVGKAVG